MLNPEGVDYNKGKVKITFSDDDGESVIKIYLAEDDAWKLHQMIQDRCNMPAQRRRTSSDENFDPKF